jgi:DNA-binding transcriptional LysR family regulator
MDLRRLRYFVAVAEELHFRRAAQRLHLAQPALSQQVRKLEVEVGAELFHRTQRGVALTAAGEVFLRESRRLLRQAEEASAAARDASTGAGGRLRLGQVADTVPAVLPRALAAFASRYPAVTVVPEIAPMRSVVEDVRTGRLDLAVVGLPAPVEGLDVVPIGVERIVAAVPDRHLLSGRPSIAVAALGQTPLVLLPRPTNPAFYDAAVGAVRAAGIAPPLLDGAATSVEHALMLVASGVALALLPSSVADRYRTVGVSFRPLDPPAPATEIALVTRPDPVETAIAAFVRVIRELERPGRAVASALRAVESEPLPLTA